MTVVAVRTCLTMFPDELTGLSALGIDSFNEALRRNPVNAIRLGTGHLPHVRHATGPLDDKPRQALQVGNWIVIRILNGSVDSCFRPSPLPEKSSQSSMLCRNLPSDLVLGVAKAGEMLFEVCSLASETQ